MDSSLWGFSVHGTSQARLMEQVVISFSRGSSQPKNRTNVSCIAGGFLHCRWIYLPLSYQASLKIPYKTEHIYICVCVYVYMYVCVCVCIYIYIYKERYKSRVVSLVWSQYPDLSWEGLREAPWPMCLAEDNLGHPVWLPFHRAPILQCLSYSRQLVALFQGLSYSS